VFRNNGDDELMIDNRGVFAVMAQQPGCAPVFVAPGLLGSLIVRMQI
jgi:hypothetical protein